MNKFKIIGAILLCSLFCFACSEDERPLPSNPLEEGVLDVLGGYNCLMFSIDSISDIELHTKLPVRLNYTEHPLVNFTVERINGKQVIRTALKQEIKREDLPISVKLNINIHPEKGLKTMSETDRRKYHKTCYVILRSDPAAMSAADSLALGYAKGYIGHGTQLHQDFGNAAYSIFEFDRIYEKMDGEEVPLKEFDYKEYCGSRYTETLDQIAGGFNLSGLSKHSKKGICFSGGTSLNVTNSKLNIGEYEFFVGIYSVNMAELKLDPLSLLPDSVGKNCPEVGYTAYMTSTINNVLNNPGSPAYQTYSNQPSGIDSLLTKYGTHIITKATFGGSHTTLYGREASIHQNSVAVQFTASGQGKKKVETAEGTKPWVAVYTNRTGSPNMKGDFNINCKEGEIDEATAAITKVTMRGGFPSENIDKWVDSFKETDKRATWCPVSYGTKDNSDPCLIPLYDRYVCLDTARRRAIENYLPLYLDRHAPEIKDMSTLKIVDFYMKTGTENHAKDEAKPFVETDPWGVKRIYYPLTANTNAPSADKFAGYALETSGTDYFSLAESADHYWYYAVAHTSDTSSHGILDILFSDLKSIEGYTKRGEDANKHSGGDMRQTYVHLKCTEDEDDANDYIRAVGLTLTKVPDDKKSMLGKTIGSTAGTEMQLPFNNGQTLKDFNDFWNINDNRNTYLKTSHKDCAQETFYDGKGWVAHHYQFKPYYITNDVFYTENLLFGTTDQKPKFVHPRTWGEDPY